MKISLAKRRIVLGLVVVAVVGLVAVAVWPGPKEPEYQGKKLSEWLEVYIENNQAINPAAGDAKLHGSGSAEGYVKKKGEAAEAIRQIGTNAVPILLTWIKYEPPQWMLRIARTASRHPSWVGSSYVTRHFETNEIKLRLAAIGFVLLGEQAAGAIPELARIGRNPARGRLGTIAIQCLPFLGQDALQPLIGLATDKSLGTRRCFAMISLRNLTYLGTNALPCIAALRTCASETDSRITPTAVGVLEVFAASDSLAAADDDSVILVQAFLNAEDRRRLTPDPVLRRAAVRALADFGASNTVAFAACSRATDDLDAGVRAEAVRGAAIRQAYTKTHGDIK